MAKRGGEFIEQYSKYLSEDFGEDQKGLALSPEIEVLRRLRATDQSPRLDRQETTRKDREARRLALLDTALRFTLPVTVTAKEIERMRFVPADEAIYLFYKSRYTLYLLAPVDLEMPDKESVRTFKQHILMILSQMKADNFRGFLERASQETDYSLTLAHAGREVVVNSETAKVFDVQPAHASETPKVDQLNEVTVKRGILAGWLDRHRKKWSKKDFRLAQKAYEPLQIESHVSPRVLRLDIQPAEGKARESILLNEEAVGDILNTVKPLGYFGTPQEELINRRYLLEAASRNAMYTNMIGFLEESDDRSRDEFALRLQQRIQALGESRGWYANRSLSERLRDFSGSFKLDSPIVRVLWAGWGFHPDFWAIRENSANELQWEYAPKGQVYSPSKEKGKDGRRSRREFAKQIRIEKERQSTRYATDGARARHTYFVRLRRAAMAAAAAGTLWLGYQAYQNVDFEEIRYTLDFTQTLKDAWKTPEWVANAKAWTEDKLGSSKQGDSQAGKTSESKNGSAIQRDTPVDDKKSSNLTIKGVPGFSLSNFDQPTNIQIDKKQGSRANDSGTGGQTNFGWNLPYKIKGETDKVLYYLVPGRAGMEKIPGVFDTLRKGNIPAKFQNLSVNLPENYNFANQLHFFKSDAATSDFSVQTNLVHFPDNGRIPVASSAEARLTGLEVRNTKGQTLVSGRDYNVYIMNESHLVWIRLQRDVGGIGYRASYEFNKSLPKVPDSMINLKIPDLKKVDKLLIDAGITSLGKALQTRRNREMYSTTVFKVTADMKVNATYTYDSKMWPMRGSYKNPFRYYSKFVDEKGDLQYQCTGANGLLSTYLNQYYEFAGFKDVYRAENTTAYVRTEAAPVITLDGAHYRTMAYRVGSYGEFRILDSTPGGVSESVGAHSLESAMEYEIGVKEKEEPAKEIPPEDKPAKDKFKDMQMRGVLPERTRVPKPVEDEPQPVKDPEAKPEVKAEEKPPEKVEPKVDLTQEELLRKLRELTGLRDRGAHWLARTASEEMHVARKLGRDEIPGSPAIVFATRLQDYVLGKYLEKDFLASLISASIRWPQPDYWEGMYFRSGEKRLNELKAQGLTRDQIIEKTMSEAEKAFLTQIKFVENQAAQGEMELDFSLDEDLQRTVRKLFKLMRSTKWAQLTPEYRMKFNGCENALTTIRKVP